MKGFFTAAQDSVHCWLRLYEHRDPGAGVLMTQVKHVGVFSFTASLWHHVVASTVFLCWRHKDGVHVMSVSSMSHIASARKEEVRIDEVTTHFTKPCGRSSTGAPSKGKAFPSNWAFSSSALCRPAL